MKADILKYIRSITSEFEMRVLKHAVHEQEKVVNICSMARMLEGEVRIGAEVKFWDRKSKEEQFGTVTAINGTTGFLVEVAEGMSLNVHYRDITNSR